MADFDNQIRDAVLCKCRSDYVRRKMLEEREELTLARTLKIAEQCESVDHQMSHLSVREPSKEDANRFYETPERPGGKQKRKMEFSAIVVGRVGTWVEIQNALLRVRLVGSVRVKIILLASEKPNQRIEELIKCKKS